MRWKAGPSFSRRRRVCGLWVATKTSVSEKQKSAGPATRACAASRVA
jgi:hypothetical protein